MKERESYLPLLSALGLYAVAFGAFGHKLKQEAREEVNYVCQICKGTDYRGECHHRVPQCQGGTDRKENLVYVCGPHLNDCHEELDKKALEEKLYLHPNGEMVTKDQMPEECKGKHDKRNRRHRRRR